ncbi:MAG: YHS domain-containing protein [Candidatus Krumholzibacteria bacterium]|nr:YHS domain-containing protein [Candidatus Krumholzibacteria bacterium]
MKKVLILCLVFMVAFSFTFGCSKKKEPEKKEISHRETTKGGLKASLIDPVSKEPVDIDTTPYYYIYDDTEFHFKTEENMKAFKADPEKYLVKK